MTLERRPLEGGEVHLRLGIMEPKADVLLLHGFADRFDNHLPLFEQ
jgi:hypothetical protein